MSDLPKEILSIHEEYLGISETSMKSLGELALALSERVGRNPPWTANMLLSTIKRHKGFTEENTRLREAIRRLRKSMTGDTMIMSPVDVLAPEAFPDKVTIMTPPRQCKCGRWFVPRQWNHKRCFSWCKS